MSDGYKNSSFPFSLILPWIWVKIILAKYIAAWLFAEGTCILSGLAYNGTDEKTSEVKWNGMANVKLRRY